MPVKRRRVDRRGPSATERLAQKRRTRKAIVDAAIALLARGDDAVGQRRGGQGGCLAADGLSSTSRRVDHLLLDATAGALSQAAVDRAVERWSCRRRRPGARSSAWCARVQHVTPEMERLGRALDPPDGQRERAVRRLDGMPRRGYRRIEWIESALSPWRDRHGFDVAGAVSFVRAGDGRRMGSR